MASSQLSKALKKEIFDNIKRARAFAQDDIAQFFKYMNYAYNCSLTKDDLAQMEAEDKPTFEFSVLNPLIKKQLKEVSDSVPNVDIQPNDSEDAQSIQIADALSQKVRDIFDANNMGVKFYEVGKTAIPGGFGVFELKTDYKNNRTFEQKIIINAADNPTIYLFDPSAKRPDKSDSNYVIKLQQLTEAEFKRLFPKINVTKLKENFERFEEDETDINWISGTEEGKRQIYVAEYFYYKSEDVTLYQLSDRQTISIKDGQEIPGFINGAQVVDERSVKDKIVCKVTVCGDKKLNGPEESNFRVLPFVYVGGNSYVDESGKQCTMPYIKQALDAQRLKNFIANYFLFDLVNRNDGTWVVGRQSTPESVIDELKVATTKRKVIEYEESYLIDGTMEPSQGVPPRYEPPEQVNPQMLEMMSVLNTEIERIVGAEYQAIDESNMSGKALTNLSDFVSAANDPFMQSLYQAVEQIGRIVISTLPEIMLKNESVTVGSGNKAQQLTLPHDFDHNFFDVHVDRAPTTRLMKQQSVEFMVKVAQLSPAFGQWLATQGLEYLFDNIELSGKSEIVDSFNQWMMQQQQSQQQNQQQNPDSIKAQAFMINAQANMAKAQGMSEENQIKMAELAMKNHESKSQLMKDLQHLNVQREDNQVNAGVEMHRINSENQRAVLDKLFNQQTA
jgi:hypothetical protein